MDAFERERCAAVRATGGRGRLIAASLGPGDPGLITRKAWEALQRASCWAWPSGTDRREGASYALEIVTRAGLTPPARGLPLAFPMTRSVTILARHWQLAAERTLEVLREGIDVVFLVEGDASFFATFGYLARTVRSLDPEVVVEIIPGVTSPLAAAALEGVPLCEGDQALAVAAATVGMERIERMLDDFDALVLMKVRPVLPELLDLVERRGLQERCCFLERVGAPGERRVTDVLSLREEEVHYLSLMIIHSRPAEWSFRGPLDSGGRGGDGPGGAG